MYNKDYFAQLRADRKAKGLCLSCGKHPVPCEPCKTRNREYMRNKRAGIPKEAKQKVWREKRDYHLKYRFGIGVAEYNEMLRQQNGGCAICGTTDSKDSRTKHFSIDHCHATGKIRGLLCNNCNRALGGFEDSIEHLKAAINYLKRSK